MFPYIFTYSISCFVLYIGLKIKKNSPIRVLLIFIALLFPALLAGLRDGSVGTDTLTLEHFFEYCKVSNISQIFSESDYEIGFKLFVYSIARIVDNVFWLHFAIEFFVVFFVWKAIDENVADQYKVFAVLLYYLLFYSFSLNIIRQMMSMSILLFSYTYIKRKELLKFLLCVLVSFFFHKASIFGLALYPIYCVCLQNDATELQKKQNRLNSFFRKLIYKFRFLLVLIGITMTLLVVFYAREIIAFAHFYFDDYYYIYQDSGASSLRYTLYMVALLIVTAYTFQFKHTEFLYYFLVFVISLILYHMSSISGQAYRIAMFFSIYFVVLIPQVIFLIKGKMNRAIVISTVLIIVFMYSYDFFILREYNGTYPYIFRGQ